MHTRLLAAALVALVPAFATAEATSGTPGVNVESGPWTASVHVGIRYEQGIVVASRVVSDTVITGLPTREACLAAGRLVANQKISGEAVYEAEGSVLCINVLTGEAETETVRVE